MQRWEEIESRLLRIATDPQKTSMSATHQGHQNCFKNYIRGAVYGALAGDALGVPVEFSSRAARLADPVRGMRAHGTWNQPAGTWSDDGALLLCSIEALAQSADPAQADFDADHMGALFVDWMQNARWAAGGDVFDIGDATLRALGRIERGTPAQLAGGDGDRDNGNGSLMRILPVALRFASASTPRELSTLAMRASAITHAHPRSQLACACLCLVAQQIIAGLLAKPPSETKTHTFISNCLNAASRHFQTLLANYPDEQPHFERLTSGGIKNTQADSINSGGYVIHTLEASLWCLLTNNSYDETVLAAVNLGGDTDTTACVAGGLAGLLYGHDTINPEWIFALPQRDSIDRLLERFERAIC